MHILQPRNSRYIFNRNMFICASNNMHKDVHRNIKKLKQLKYSSLLNKLRMVQSYIRIFYSMHSQKMILFPIGKNLFLRVRKALLFYISHIYSISMALKFMSKEAPWWSNNEKNEVRVTQLLCITKNRSTIAAFNMIELTNIMLS